MKDCCARQASIYCLCCNYALWSATVRLVAVSYLYFELIVKRTAVQDRPVFTVSAVTMHCGLLL